MTQTPGRPLRFWLLAATAVLALVLLLHSATFKAFLNEVVAWAEGIMLAHPVWGAVVFFLFSALSAMLAFASSVVLVPPANLVWGKIPTFFLLWGGWITGAATAFAIGRGASPLLMRLGPKEKLEKYQEYVSNRMQFWAMLIFCIAVPSEIPGYLFGGMKYPFLKFIAAIGIAEAIYALGVIVAGDKLLGAEPGLFLLVLGIMAAVAIAAGLALHRLRKRRPGDSAPEKRSSS